MNAQVERPLVPATGEQRGSLFPAGITLLFVGSCIADTGIDANSTFSQFPRAVTYTNTAGSAPGILRIVKAEQIHNASVTQKLGQFVNSLAQRQTPLDADMSRILRGHWNELFD